MGRKLEVILLKVIFGFFDIKGIVQQLYLNPETGILFLEITECKSPLRFEQLNSVALLIKAKADVFDGPREQRLAFVVLPELNLLFDDFVVFVLQQEED